MPRQTPRERAEGYLRLLEHTTPLSEKWLEVEDTFLDSLQNLNKDEREKYLRRYNEVGVLETVGI